jgi:8-oxo-dGTP diphosphatase
LFLYEVTHPVKVERMTFDEGTLEWHDRAAIDSLDIPQTDRQIIWPLFWRHRRSFFMAHIDCRDGALRWTVQQGALESDT